MTTFKQIALAFATLALASQSGFAQESVERYIVKYKAGDKASVASQIRQVNGEIMLELDKHRLFSADLTADDMGRLSNSDEIEFIEVDPKRFMFAEVTPPALSMMNVGNGIGQVAEPLMTDRKVCIIDSGFDYTHEDLQSSRITGDDEIVSVSGNITHDTGDWWDDESGHGTHIGGIIAAIGGNNLGTVGVNPGNRLNLHIVKTFVSPMANYPGFSFWVYGSTKIAALDQCVAAGSNIINMSFGGQTTSVAENQAIQAIAQSNILMVAAAGNHGLTQTGYAANYPAHYDAVINVTNVDNNGFIAPTSTYSLSSDIAAPGVGIYSTMPSNWTTPSASVYATKTGTSMSAAYVSGAAALLWGHYPACTAWQIRAALLNSAVEAGAPGRDPYYGYGIIDVKAAYDALDLSALNGNGCVVQSAIQISNGGTQTGLAGGQGTQLNYSMIVGSSAANSSNAVTTSVKSSSGFTSVSNTKRKKPGAPKKTKKSGKPNKGLKDLSFKTFGGTGNVDMYVRYGAMPTIDIYDCLSNGPGVDQDCDFPKPQDGKYYVMLQGASAFSGVSLTGGYTDKNNPLNQDPKASFSLNCTNLVCTFDADSSSDRDGNIQLYNWSFGDGNTSIGINPSHSFSAVGNYDVSLTVTDDDGAVGSITQTLEVISINLGARVRLQNEKNLAVIYWSGATTEEVDLFVNAKFSRRIKNTGYFVRELKSKAGVETYQICNSKSKTNCSSIVTAR